MNINKDFLLIYFAINVTINSKHIFIQQICINVQNVITIIQPSLKQQNQKLIIFHLKKENIENNKILMIYYMFYKHILIIKKNH